jgi:hypothetical protein
MRHERQQLLSHARESRDDVVAGQIEKKARVDNISVNTTRCACDPRESRDVSSEARAASVAVTGSILLQRGTAISAAGGIVCSNEGSE